MKPVHNTLRWIWLFLNRQPNNRDSDVIYTRKQTYKMNKLKLWTGDSITWWSFPWTRPEAHTYSCLCPCLLLTWCTLIRIIWLLLFPISSLNIAHLECHAPIAHNSLKISCCLKCPGLCPSFHICSVDSVLSNHNSPPALLVCSFLLIVQVWA